MVVLALVAGLGTVALVRWWPRGGPSPTPSSTSSPPTLPPVPSARQEAATLDGILSQSAKGRTLVVGALGDAQRCARQGGVRDDLRTAIKLRTSAVTRTEQADLDALPHADALRAQLLDLLHISVKADEAYLAWASSTSPCRNLHSSDYQLANTYSIRATKLKKSFLGRWNPIARKYGLSDRDEGGI